MTRKAFYPGRPYHKRSMNKRLLMAKRISSPHLSPIASLVQEAQNPVCYINFTRNHLYSNTHLRSLCPAMVTRSFSNIEDMTHFFYETFEKHEADMTDVTNFWEELLTNRYGCCPSLEAKSLRIGERTMQLISNFTFTPRGVFIIWHDITDAIRCEEQKDAFLAQLSHEFRSPLTAINGYAELLMHQQEDNPKTHGMLTLVKRETERLERLVDNFLDYQRVNYSVELLSLSTFNLKSTLDDVVNYYTTTSTHHDFCLTAHDVSIQADREKLLQLLHNLIGNAIKYSPNGGTIYIDVNTEDDHLVLSIRDTGIGIPADAIPHIFDEYYRVDSEAHRPIKGTGLGLRICKRIAEAHGWGIHADSVYGEGTTFSIMLYSPDQHTSI